MSPEHADLQLSVVVDGISGGVGVDRCYKELCFRPPKPLAPSLTGFVSLGFSSMDSDSGVAAEEIKNAVGGSGAGDAEREVDEQKGEDGSPGGAGGDEEDKKGSGQKLKDIPNVSFKLSKRKADENLRALHSLLFGRKSTEKQRIRVKEKLDKYNKERLLDFCDLLDIHAVKTTTKKKLRTSNQQSTADENGDNEENVAGDAKDEMHDGEDDGESQEESDHGKSEEEEEQDERAPTNKSSVAKRTKKNIAPSEEKSKVTPVKQMASGKRSSEDDLDVSSEDDPSSPPESKKDSNREMNEPERKVSAKEKRSRRNKSARGTKSTSTSSAKKSDSLDDSESEPPPDSKSKKVGRKGRTKEKTPSKKEATGKTKISKSESKETANKKRGKSKLSEAKKNEPSTEELHSVVSKILKEVDFNTATLADILRQLGAHFNTNLMDRNAEVKRIIEDLTFSVMVLSPLIGVTPEDLTI
ncbi:hypothetical protein ZIOFF_026322 [Zingiber officinale]|uniref:DEK-C domain-containing protein n=1 Tax=Zingiber officinale TaxID=94328 RepID=A0A8J5GW88_ZINOF|nr:hypothetical protein ZIOFF_026322 [Zingiber officinale]